MDGIYKKIHKDIVQRYSNDLSACYASFAESKLAIAVSGGVDSVFLSLLTQAALAMYGRDTSLLHILIVNHNIRPEAWKESRHVRDMMRGMGFKNVHLLEIYPKDKQNIMHKCREMRYGAMSEWCIEHNVPILLVGHNKNDQAETILQRMLFGTSITGLIGMEKAANIYGSNVIRPLLSWHREEIEGAMRDIGVDWVEDPSNKNLKYDRVKIRELLADMASKGLGENLASIVNRICKTSENLARAAKFIDMRADSVYREAVVEHGDYAVVDTNILSVAEQEMGMRVFKRVLEYASAGRWVVRPRLEVLDKIWHLSLSGKPMRNYCICKCIVNSYSKEKPYLWVFRSDR